MSHLQEMMAEHDARTARIIKTQLLDPRDPRYGAFVGMYHVDSRNCGFMLGHIIVSYVCKESAHYLDAGVRAAIEASFVFMQNNLRPSGCVDLTGCNFDSAPDTAFTANELISAWWLMEKRMCEAIQWLSEPFRQLLVTMARGIAAGGFHTPNHRWAIASCLKSVSKIASLPELSVRADEYLSEGLDINEDGEFAERSAGTYNQVNDEQMIRLYLATGDISYLEAVRQNLNMMLAYIDPDNSVFTGNSTRQDNGRKVYLGSYYILFLLAGHFLADAEMTAMAEYCYRTARAAATGAPAWGAAIPGVAWLLLIDGLDACENCVDPKAFTHFNRYFHASKIARMREGNLSMTAMEGKPNFLYIQHGALSMYMVIHSQICAECNFLPKTITPIENGYRLSSTVNGWYYLPFYPDVPETSDWWAMDNAHTRKRIHNVSLTTTVEVIMQEDGVDITLHAEGYTGIPLRVELGFLPCGVRHDSFVMDGAPGGGMILRNGMLELTGKAGDVLTIENGFAEHGSLARRDSAYLQSKEHFTVYLTAYTPVEKTFRIGTRSFEKKDLLPWEAC